MASKKVASARTTQLVSTYGIGALFPAMDESFMVLGLSEWPDQDGTEIAEPRLARALGVHGFRTPPSGGTKGPSVPVVRFPRWYSCPQCHRLDELQRFCSWDEHECPDCHCTLVPSRFVACCPRGHIEDFPYFTWVHAGQRDLQHQGDHRMRLRSSGGSSSLGAISVSCSCGVQDVSMAHSFDADALKKLAPCRGQRPWLSGATDEDCSETLRTLQRGSSNVWFSSVRSALSIPPWSHTVQRLVDRHWKILRNAGDDSLPALVRDLALPGIDVDDLVAAVTARRSGEESEAPTEEDLRRDEYKALSAGQPDASVHQQFVVRPVGALPETAGDFELVSEVARLREVRALDGFTRVRPHDPQEEQDRRARLSLAIPDWLPAMEVLGEGIFLRFDPQRLAQWESSDFARRRTAVVQQAEERRAKEWKLREVVVVRARELLLHTFAHVLLNELSLDAGYPVASLRERVYAADDQAGVLLYTASSDSAGSLGGLAAQSAPERIEAVVTSAVRRASWCSSDPVCIEATSTGADGLNMAACHACVVLPETSCDLQNAHLDRATLVGTLDDPSTGYFGGRLLA